MHMFAVETWGEFRSLRTTMWPRNIPKQRSGHFNLRMYMVGWKARTTCKIHIIVSNEEGCTAGAGCVPTRVSPVDKQDSDRSMNSTAGIP